jgi:hypothetical protein
MASYTLQQCKDNFSSQPVFNTPALLPGLPPFHSPLLLQTCATASGTLENINFVPRSPPLFSYNPIQPQPSQSLGKKIIIKWAHASPSALTTNLVTTTIPTPTQTVNPIHTPTIDRETTTTKPWKCQITPVSRSRSTISWRGRSRGGGLGMGLLTGPSTR